MSNNETFMAVAIIYSLQKFHIHYGMDVVGKEAWGSFVVVVFFLFCRISLFKKKIMRGYSMRYFNHFSFYFVGHTFD
jgi:hypothetical protein